MTSYGPDAKCQRAACADEPAHVGGEHIDPRSGRYDGPGVTFRALPETARRAAHALREAGAPIPEVVDMAREILRLRGQVAAVQVDRDRQVRAALARSESCETHGQEIAELGKQLHEADKRAERNDRGRVTLLVLPQMIEALSALPTLTELKRAARKTLDAHGRVWK